MNIVENWQAKLIPLDSWSFSLQNDNAILILCRDEFGPTAAYPGHTEGMS